MFDYIRSILFWENGETGYCDVKRTLLGAYYMERAATSNRCMENASPACELALKNFRGKLILHIAATLSKKKILSYKGFEVWVFLIAFLPL